MAHVLMDPVFALEVIVDLSVVVCFYYFAFVNLKKKKIKIALFFIYDSVLISFYLVFNQPVNVMYNNNYVITVTPSDPAASASFAVGLRAIEGIIVVVSYFSLIPRYRTKWKLVNSTY